MAFKPNIYIIYYFVVLGGLVGQISCCPSKKSIIQQQIRLTMDLCDKLIDIHNFDTVIIYQTPDRLYEPAIASHNRDDDEFKNDIIHKSVGNIIANHIFSHKIYKPLMIFTIAPWDYLNDTKSIPILGNKNLAIVILNDIFNVKLKDFVSVSLGSSLKKRIVFLLIGHELTNIMTLTRSEKLDRFFRWCWSKNILKVILLFQRDHIKTNLSELKLQIYTYTPFPKPINIINLTDKNPREYLQDRVKDLMGYEFKTPIYHDIPNVFKTTDPRTGLKIVTGIAGHLYMEFVKKINATLVELPSYSKNPFEEQYLYKLLNARNIDISIHPSTYLIPTGFFNSYPITNTNSCVVVPVTPEIFPGLYITLTFNLDMWIILFITFIVFQIIYILINHQIYGQWRLWESFSTTLQGILSMPISYATIKAAPAVNGKLLKRKLFILMFLSFTGLLYSHIYAAGLSSFLSSTVYPKQIETLDDLRAANISLMLLDYVFYAYNYLDLIPNNFTDHITISDPNTISHHISTLNTTYAYVVYNEEWKVIQHLQVTLWKPRFKIVSQLCVPNIYLSFPMQFNSPFYSSLKNFIMRTQSVGLMIKWSDMVFYEIQHTTAGNATKLEDDERPIPLNMEHLTYAIYMYVIGIILALIVFIWELMWGKKIIFKN